MTYLVKSIFFTLQGEGYNTGTPAVFCRFAGCNLWTGHEKQRSIAICQFCDTDFVGTDGPGGGHFKTAAELASAVESMWRPQSSAHRFVVCTGGEPLLQLDEGLVEAFHDRGFRIAIETNRDTRTSRKHRLDMCKPQGGRANWSYAAATSSSWCSPRLP